MVVSTLIASQAWTRPCTQFHQQYTICFSARRSQKPQKTVKLSVFNAFGICERKSCLQNFNEIDPRRAMLTLNCCCFVVIFLSSEFQFGKNLCSDLTRNSYKWMEKCDETAVNTNLIAFAVLYTFYFSMLLCDTSKFAILLNVMCIFMMICSTLYSNLKMQQ